MPEVIIQATVEELQKALISIYHPIFLVKIRHPRKESSAPELNDYYTLSVTGAPVKRSMRNAALKHYQQFTITTRLDDNGQFAVDDEIEITLNFAKCAIMLNGVTVFDDNDVVIGHTFPYEDPHQFARVLDAMHSHIVVSSMTNGWALLGTIIPTAAQQEFIKLLDCRYIRYCQLHDLGYKGAAEVDLGHFTFNRIYRQADYADDDIVRWPWDPFGRDDQGSKQAPSSSKQSPNSRTATVSCGYVELPGSSNSQ